MASFLIAENLVESDLVKILCSKPKGNPVSVEGIRAMDDFLFSTTKQLFGDNIEGATMFFNRIAEVTKGILTEQKLFDQNVKTALKSFKAEFQNNYFSDQKRLMEMKLTTHVDPVIGNRFQDTFIKVFELNDRVKEGWPKLWKLITILIFISVWFLFIDMLVNYANYRMLGTEDSSLVETTLFAIAVASQMSTGYNTLYEVTGGNVWWARVVQTGVINATNVRLRQLGGLYESIRGFLIIYSVVRFLYEAIIPYLKTCFKCSKKVKPVKVVTPRRSSRQRSPMRCQTCDAQASLRCNKCKEAFYCGQECQKKDWAIHKTKCVQ